MEKNHGCGFRVPAPAHNHVSNTNFSESRIGLTHRAPGFYREEIVFVRFPYVNSILFLLYKKDICKGGMNSQRKINYYETTLSRLVTLIEGQSLHPDQGTGGM